ncbi:hypothetical protein DB32_002151 [Sandaracinus amylolyticus]|uniref:Uncharacterized protein n=1 Tax=Sandaracinus amylolyticus TaxID=927083 RepID=A0A0F6W1P7_9BACT|nr:hypothetical protein DB32_002151 [Sandaracinus amylolyticus]
MNVGGCRRVSVRVVLGARAASASVRGEHGARAARSACR